MGWAWIKLFIHYTILILSLPGLHQDMFLFHLAINVPQMLLKTSQFTHLRTPRVMLQVLLLKTHKLSCSICVTNIDLRDILISWPPKIRSRHYSHGHNYSKVEQILSTESYALISILFCLEASWQYRSWKKKHQVKLYQDLGILFLQPKIVKTIA